MKQYLVLLICFCIAVCFTGCGEEHTVTPTGVSSSGSSALSVNEGMVEEPSSTPSVTLADTTSMDLSLKQQTAPTSTGSKQPVNITSLSTEKPAGNTAAPERLTIEKGGDYVLTGEKKDAMITVDAGESTVNLTLAGVTVTNQNGPALYIKSAGKVNIILAEGTENVLSDGSAYSLTDGTTDLDAALFSRADLTLLGKGSLTVSGNYKHGIVSKDDLVFSSGTYHVTAKNVAIDGKDCVKVNQGTFTLNAGTDGIRSNNTEDPNKGFVYLYDGNFHITAGNDGVQAQTLLKIDKGSLHITTGGGSENADDITGSFKGLKAGSDIRLSQGSFHLNTKDDCIHSDGTVTLSGGEYTLSSGNDGLRATTDLALSGGALNLLNCQDGIQANNVVISGGNATLHVSQSGIQAKGNYHQTGGSVTLFGRNGNGKSIFNYKGTATLEGGTLLAFGDKAKVQHLTTVNNQAALCITLPAQQENSSFGLAKDGKNLLTANPTKGYSLVIVSAPNLTIGKYTLLLNGKSAASLTVDTPLFATAIK